MALQPKPNIPVNVWVKGAFIPGYDPGTWRHDAYGSVIRLNDYGDRSSQYGWEVDHITPLALGGSDLITNLRPLHHRNNSTLGGILGGKLR